VELRPLPMAKGQGGAGKQEIARGEVRKGGVFHLRGTIKSNLAEPFG